MKITVSRLGSSRIKIHIVHPISLDNANKTKEQGFELNTYFFIPNKLAHGNGDELDGGQSWSQPVVFPKIQRKNYYEISAMSLTELLNVHNNLSPLTRLEHMAQKVILPVESVLYELQMLVCITLDTCSKTRKAQLQYRYNSNNVENREQSQNILKIGNELRNEIEAELHNIIRAYLQIQNRLGQLGERYLHEILYNISEFYQWALEDLNHQIIKWIQDTLHLSKSQQFSKKFQSELLAILEQQWLYQKQHGFATLGTNEYHNESYLFHQRELKAWRYGGLSMFSTEARRQNVMNHVWPAIASAIAMIFALTVTLLSMNYYGQWSLPFLVFAVLGYMFKDRIKEILRNLFSDKFGNYNLLSLYDPRSKKQCGSIRESLDVCDLLPTDIATLRKLHKHPLSNMYNHEVTIGYHEQFRINSFKLLKTHRRLQNGCQILEFNLGPYLQNIKESESKQLWSPTEQTEHSGASGLFPDLINIKRSYHLTLIIKIKTICGQEIKERYRIVLRGKKIAWLKRIV